MSKILDFYRGEHRPEHGGTFTETLDATDVFWERNHTFIQWMFPLPTASQMQPTSPVATEEDYKAFISSPVLKMRMLSALGRYFTFLDNTTPWRMAHDHNHLRITRVIRCLVLCGMYEDAALFFNYVKSVLGDKLPAETLHYWQDALGASPPWGSRAC